MRMPYIYSAKALVLVAFVLLCSIKDEGPSSALASPLFGKSTGKGLSKSQGKLGSTGQLVQGRPRRSRSPLGSAYPEALRKEPKPGNTNIPLRTRQRSPEDEARRKKREARVGRLSHGLRIPKL
uniref:Uncharacterized protein n=1 Tax=Rhipicephalus zambeziensis TaxID=60191 RepID=A0A224Z1T9_9ACAR